MNDQYKHDLKLAEEVRKSCLAASREAFQEASVSGLCSEGAMEAATGSIQSLDMEQIIARVSS